ncbi:hypothetical protein F5Y18DRAFT_415625 [Xylariaceae sp. FL1019]|nr:hypothetical protein F5Y18DRAFT_415625 [Xylariaceae sp. FL1019]
MTPHPTSSLLFDQTAIAHASNATVTAPVAHVVCAWPVSGQYGFGTRLLYYFLVAACVWARNKEWIRDACLAAALLLPAVAAIHAIVLASLHVDDAVDLDIYGAFQICSIGILAAPITVGLSDTYFKSSRRNLIFLWTSLVLAGMLSLTVEFFRSHSHPCSVDNDGNRIDPFNARLFPYENADCSLNCIDGAGGPHSPLRFSGTSDIYVLPAPKTLTFGATTLLAAGTSIPPILTLIFTWEKVRKSNWKKEHMNQELEGTNGATLAIMGRIDNTVDFFKKVVLTSLFTGIVIVLLVLGEVNFWSKQMTYRTEPFASVGQWSNVVATFLLIASTLYIKEFSEPIEQGREKNPGRSPSRSSAEDQGSVHSTRPSRTLTRRTTGGVNGDTGYFNHRIHNIPVGDLEGGHVTFDALATRETEHVDGNENVPDPIGTHRTAVAGWLNKIGDYIGTPKPSRYDDSGFWQGPVRRFPDVPGELQRNANFHVISQSFSVHRQLDDDQRSIAEGMSRVNSLTSIRISESGGPKGSRLSISPPRHPRSSRSSTMPAQERNPSLAALSRTTTSPTSPTAKRERRDTLDVPNRPTALQFRHRRGSSLSDSQSPMIILQGQGSPTSPAIVLSAEPYDDDSDETPTRPAPIHPHPS